MKTDVSIPAANCQRRRPPLLPLLLAALYVLAPGVPAPADEVFRWHARPGAFERLNPPWDPAEVVSRSGGIEEEGSQVVLRVGPLRQRWVAEHWGCRPGREFQDRQLAGPFALWRHAHRMEPDGDAASVLEDEIEYALPGGVIGDFVGSSFVRSTLERVFTYRHRVTADDLAAHAGCREEKAMKVAVTGSSGLIGSALVPFLTGGGHEVRCLVRRAPRGDGEVHWNPSSGEIDTAALEGVDAVVHLSGEGALLPAVPRRPGPALLRRAEPPALHHRACRPEPVDPANAGDASGWP